MIELRQLLKQAGVDSAAVDALSDAQILEALQAAQSGGPSSGPSAASPDASAAPSPSAAEVRDLLLKGGVPAKDLEGVSDADLLKVYQDTLEELQRVP